MTMFARKKIAIFYQSRNLQNKSHTDLSSVTVHSKSYNALVFAYIISCFDVSIVTVANSVTNC